MKKRAKIIHLILLGLLGLGKLSAQESVVIHGRVTDPALNEPLPHLMVVSKLKGTGSFGEPNGTFSIKLSSRDTLLISVPGYTIESIPVPDGKDSVFMHVTLHRLEKTLRPLTVQPDREAEEIRKDLMELEAPETRTVTGLSQSMSSPITYLYERFSRFEKSKREVARLEYEYQQRELLKELFRIYVDHKIIKLDDEEFEAFVLYLNFPDEFIRHATQYDLVMAVKQRYERWSVVNKAYYNR